MLTPLRLVWRLFALVCVVLLASIFLLRNCSGKYEHELPKNALALLKAEADSCKVTRDVSIAAGLWYGDTLIATAHNNVSGANNAGGHAEINVLSKALKKYGYKNFMALNRDSLLLLSTYEPCYMCMGAITEYKIEQVVFIGKKKTLYRLRKEDTPLLQYWKTKKHYESSLQDDLFEDYHKEIKD